MDPSTQSGQSAERLVPLPFTVDRYEYRGETDPPGICEDWLLPEVDPRGNPLCYHHDIAPNTQLLETQLNDRIAEEARRSYDTGYERGLQDSLTAEHEAQQSTHAEELQLLATTIEHMTEAFASERARYYERLEQEAVKLALALAGRILRREAQMDPLFLLGAVRVALGQLTASTKVRLRVPSADAGLWTEAVALLPNRDTRPEVIGAQEMRVGQCVMETELGSVDLGVRAQLGEIERAMFDRAPSSADPDPVAVGP